MERLQRMVDELATRAMLADDTAGEIEPILAMLGRLAACAGEDGNEALREAAQNLSGAPGSADAIREGLTRLQAILEGRAESVDPDAETPPPAWQSDPDMVREFFGEVRDHLTNIESMVLTLEQDPTNQEAVHATFRCFHTIKGLCGFLELSAMQQVAHEVETLLDLVRNGRLAVSGALVDVILAGADYLRNEILRVEAVLGGQAGLEHAAMEPLIERVRAVSAQDGPNGEECPRFEPQESNWPEASTAIPAGEVFLDSLPTAEEPAAVSVTPVSPPAAAASPATTQNSTAQGQPGATNKRGSESRIVKVDTAKLDFLVDMVGELVIAQSMIRHDGALTSAANPQLQRNLSRLSRITGEVQKTAMAMRMVPIGQLFQKSVRLVRDLSRKIGKQAEVELSGEDTELDRTIVEDLSDPLMHMIRNAVDHGTEAPEERERLGKPAVARIGLKAYHQAGHIVIEVSDDGRGIDRGRVLRKAMERGLVSDGSNLSDREVFNLIFEPGFSTAEKITDVSGRGVGTDVVLKQIQKMRGRVDIQSSPGKGTRFFMNLPLTLAIIDGLVVGVGRERYIVPIFAVREIFRPQPDSIFTVENRDEMIRVRGGLLPVVRLHRRFGVDPRSEDLTEGVVVVADSGGRRYCLAVDELIGKQEVVIKGLGESFKDVAGLAGGAILGDGRVGLILDMEGVFQGGSRV